MKISDIIIESKIGKIGKRKSQSTRGLHKFRDKEFADRIYELNRVMMAAACTDGNITPQLDGESWAGRHNISAPYTEEEQNMLLKAYQAVGSSYKDINKGDLRSQELKSTNKNSIAKPFKGF